MRAPSILRTKRCFDIAASALALTLLSPLLLAIALAVKLTSPGPILYRGQRVGLLERPFRIYKFRSMVVDADRNGPWWTSSDDARITPLGRVLRQTSLDELPQLVNVLEGDMSLVGPRPASFGQLGHYSARQRGWRSSVRPGITGLAQVNGRSSLRLSRAIALDTWYARHASLARDLRIIAATAGVLVSGRGTN